MTILDGHQTLKRELVDGLRAVATLAGDVGMTTLRAEILETRVPKLEEERFHLVVLGEFNHGKSTFVNALLGADVLPTGITPTTATINHVTWAAKPSARAVLLDGKSVDVPLKKLADWVTVAGGHAAEVRHVEVDYPAELLKAQVTLVDTPGVNDLNEQRAEITYGYLPRADAVLFLLDAAQALKESERTFLASRVLERSRDRMLFVLGKTDLLSADELTEVLRYLRERLAPLIGEPTIFSVSSRRELAGKREESGFGPLLTELRRVLADERGRILLDNAAGDGLRQLAYLKQSLGVRRAALELSLSELEERVARVREQLGVAQKSLAELAMRIKAEAEAVKAQVRLDVETFVKRFAAALPAEIDRADAGDVKRYLPGFIQDKFKEWAEAEGEKVAALLERLAEEVISVTNENTRAVTAVVANRLGPGDTRVDLEVDHFKYDVSIYAVGALGTTVFLFVNSLVGGLLTLAAPILAIVWQSRMAAEVKEQAKEKAPEAVARAGEAVRPHFERIVDDFAVRLEQFVAAAGDKLYRGIGEVLDRAMAERKTRGDAVTEPLSTVDAQLAEANRLESSFGTLRSRVWEKPGA